MKNIVSVLFTLILCVLSNFSYSQSEYVEILCTNEDFKQSEFYKVKPFNGKQHTYNSFLGELFIQFDEDQIVMTDKDTGQILEFDLEEKKSLYVNGKKRPNVICEYKNLELINKVNLKDKFKPSFD